MSPITETARRLRRASTSESLGDPDDWELSPVQSQVWTEYDEAIRERRDRLARRQSWLFRHRFAIAFWGCLAGLVAIEAFALWAINRFYLRAW